MAGNQRKQSWVRAAALGAAVPLIAVTVAVVSAPGASAPHLAHIEEHGQSRDDVPTTTTNAPATTTTDCNVLEQLVGLCAAPTTATPTTSDTTTSTSTARSTSTTTSMTTTTTTTTDPPGSGRCAGTAPPIPSPSGSWTCTLDDEFNGTSLDTSTWQPVLTSTSGYETGPVLSMVCYVDDPSTISESGGALNVSVVEVSPPATCAQPGGWGSVTAYEGGMIASYKLFSQQYGYFETRAEMPPTSVPGLQETLWLYPENESLYGPWPDSGEIDYGEFYSNYPTDDVPAVHYPGSTADPDATATNGCTVAGHATRGAVQHLCPRLDPDNDHGVLQRRPVHHGRLRITCRKPRHCARTVQPALLSRVHVGLRHERQRRLPTRRDAAAGHDEDRLGESLAVLTNSAPGVYGAAVEFSKELHDDIAAGDITVSYRLWRRPHAKVGGRYRVGRVDIVVDRMDLVPFADIPEDDIRRAESPIVRPCAGAPRMPGRSPTTRSSTGLRSTWSGSRRDEGSRRRLSRHTPSTRRSPCSTVPLATGA